VKTASFVLGLLGFAALPGHSASVEITVTDARGGALEDAVVWAMPKAAAAAPRPREAVIEQMDSTFIPLVTVVRTGTAVRFPNRDGIRHHVYSFSPAKTFQIRLYAGTPAPIVFDKPGEVVLGCNIHDHMIAYVYVVDTPWFAKTGGDGHARIDAVPAGDYDLHLWHFAQAAATAPRAIRLRGGEPQASAFAVALRPPSPRSTPK
jgi:plastocyanin